MKTTSSISTFGAVAMTAACLLSLPQLSRAKDHDDDKHGHGKSSKQHKDNDKDKDKDKDNDKGKAKKDNDQGNVKARPKVIDHHDYDHDHDNDRQVYSSHPRSGFTLSQGNGYAGRGYYYGPPNAQYYYERPDVHYYATREAAPREYYSNQGNQGAGGILGILGSQGLLGNQGNQSYQGNEGYNGPSRDAAVQRELARRGYYNGPIDGAIGPQSRRSISRYQQEHGLLLNGNITLSLLHSLGIE